MNRLVKIIPYLILSSSAFALTLDKEVILDHKSEVTGSDSNCKVISGHIDNGPIIFPSKAKNSPPLPSNKNITHSSLKK